MKSAIPDNLDFCLSNLFHVLTYLTVTFKKLMDCLVFFFIITLDKLSLPGLLIIRVLGKVKKKK